MATDKEIKLIITAILNNKQFKAELKKTQTGLKQTAQTAKSVQTTLSGVFGALGVGLGVSTVIQAFKGMIQIAKEFEFAVKNAAAISGVSFKEISSIAREAGRSTQFTAKESADALTEFARAGLQTADDMRNALTPALKLAAVGQLGLADASNKMVNVIKQFNLSFEDAQMVTDNLVKSANSATTTVSELSQALSFAGPDAGRLGVSLEETTNVLAQLANQGIKSTRAGRTLRLALNRLTADVPAVNKVLEKYGITQDEIRKTLAGPNGLSKLFDRLTPVMKDAGDAVKILGVQGTSLIPIIQKGSEGFAEFQKRIDGAKGSAQLYAELSQSLEMQTKFLISAVQDLVITLTSDSGLLGGLTDIVKETKIVIDAFNDFAKATGKIDKVTKSVEDLREEQERARRKTLILKKVFAGVFGALQIGLMTSVSVAKTLFKSFFTGAILAVKGVIALGKTVRDVMKGNIKSFKMFRMNAVARLRNSLASFLRGTIKDWGNIGKVAIRTFKIITREQDKELTKREKREEKRFQKFLKTQKNKVEVAAKSQEEIDKLNAKAFEEEVKRIKDKEGVVIALEDYKRNPVEAELMREQKKYDQLRTDAEAFNLEIEGLEEQHQKRMNEIRMKGIKRGVDISKQFVTGFQTIADNILAIEMNRYNAISEEDKKARKAQKERVLVAWRNAKAYNTALVIYNTASALISSFVPYIPVLSEARAALIAGIGASQIAEIESAPEPQFRTGTEFVPGDMRAKVHKGERIIPAAMNIPGVSNADLIGAAVAGMRFASPSSAGNVFNNQRINNARTASFSGATFNLPGIQNPRQFLKWAQDEAGSMGSGVLNR